MCAFGYNGCNLRLCIRKVNLLLQMIIVMLGITGSINPSDGSWDGTTVVIGPDSFVTDGTRNLNLTCQTNESSVGAYDWKLSGQRLCLSFVSNTCTFTPRLIDDGGSVTCNVLNNSLSSLQQASYDLDLSYPPPALPSMSVNSSESTPLRNKTKITCTVSGGKPSVTHITFECQNPYHRGRQTGTGQVSVITVDTSQATADNMTCTCSAHWNPEPALYSNTTDMEFVLEYRANVINFTVNENTTTTVAESAQVTFWCQGAGRPSPRLILRNNVNENNRTNSTDPEKGLRHTIQSAQCEDLATYTCEANNDFPDPKSETVQLFVKCNPRLADNSTGSAKIYNLTQAGLTFTVVGYPTPAIAVSFCGNITARECQPAAENAFITSCERNVTMEHRVHCAITPFNITEDKTGLYTMTMKNALGNVTVTFQILHAVTPPEPTLPPADNGLSTVTIGVIAGTTTGVVGLVVIVIVIVIVVKKKKKANARTSCYNTPQQNDENNVFRSESGQTSQRVTATVQPQVHSQALHNQMSPLFVAEAGYACPADMLPSGIINPAETSTTKPNPYDPGYASADDIGMSADAQRVAVSYNPRNNSLKSRSADKSFDVTLQPAEPANKPQGDGVDEYNVLGGQGATSGPDPTYSHIDKVNKNQ